MHRRIAALLLVVRIFALSKCFDQIAAASQHLGREDNITVLTIHRNGLPQAAHV